MRSSTRVALVVLGSLACACASVPRQELQEAQSAYRAAQEVGARDVPQAAYHLELAEQQIADAKQKIDGGDGDEQEQARQLLERAELDAELAIALARTDKATARAEAAWTEVQELKTQNNPAPRGLRSPQP